MLEVAMAALPDGERACMTEALGAVRSLYDMEEIWAKRGDGSGGDLRLRRGGKTLVTFLILNGCADVMVIYGKKEREAFEMYRDSFPHAIRSVYDASHTYHDGKWMRMPLRDETVRSELPRLLAIKKRPNRKVEE